jgi:hypothetical protein
LFESKLEEGATYIMKNFKVQPNDGKVKFCDHPFTLVGFAGDGGSDIIPTKIPNIPNYKFNFKSFDDIKHGKYRADMLVGTYKVHYHYHFKNMCMFKVNCHYHFKVHNTTSFKFHYHYSTRVCSLSSHLTSFVFQIS